ncbi:hypothetical protein ACOSQ2_025405 [Xanthoceras sorbifolium]
MNHLESYPPVFRQQFDKTDDHTSLNPEGPRRDFFQDSNPIPVIDLQDIVSLEKDHKQLGEACKEWGIFRLVNHGVPLTLISQIQDQAQKLFSLSFEAKQTLFNNNSSDPALSYFWGTPALTPSGSALNPKKINWVEGFNVLLGQLPDHDQVSEDPMLDSFRLLLKEYGRHTGRLARGIFKAILKTLDMESEKSKYSHLSESTGIVRVYRYPKISKINKEATGMEVHTDSSVISILNQDQVGGLQVFKDDKWYHVQPIGSELIVNLGDMMQAISNDKYVSVKHKVMTNKQEDRLSVCYFVFPAEGSVIQSSKYKPFQAQVQDDVKTLGFKIGLERFRIS